MNGGSRQFDLLGWMISITAFLYVFTACSLSAIPYVSRVNLIISAVLGCLVLVRLLARGTRGVPKCYFLPVLFTAFAALSVTWSVDTDWALFMVSYLAFTTVGGLAIAVALNYGLSWKALLWGGILGSLTLIATGYAQQQQVGADVRIAGIAGNPNQMAMVLSYVAFMLWCCPVRRPRWMSLLAAAFVAYAFAFTGSRTTLITLAGILLLIAVKMPQKVKSTAGRFAVAVGIMIAVVVLAFTYQSYHRIVSAFSSSKVIERTQQISVGERSAEMRWEMFERGMQLWSKRPVIGYGEAQFSVVSGFPGYAHNNYTEILSNLGLIGFGLYHAFHLILLVAAVRGTFAGSPQHSSALVILLFILMMGFGTVQYLVRYDWILLAFAASLAVLPFGKQATAAVPLSQLRPIRTVKARI